MENFGIPQAMLAKIKAQAEKEYPRECCGLILGPQNSAECTRLCSSRNAQDDFHAKDPVNFPRTAKNAYFLDPHDLLRFQKEARARSEEIKVIYHSHIEAPAVFSEEDYRQAVYEEAPVYPGVCYLIFSVRSGKIADTAFYRWNNAKKKYTK